MRGESSLVVPRGSLFQLCAFPSKAAEVAQLGHGGEPPVELAAVAAEPAAEPAAVPAPPAPVGRGRGRGKGVGKGPRGAAYPTHAVIRSGSCVPPDQAL